MLKPSVSSRFALKTSTTSAQRQTQPIAFRHLSPFTASGQTATTPPRAMGNSGKCDLVPSTTQTRHVIRARVCARCMQPNPQTSQDGTSPKTGGGLKACTPSFWQASAACLETTGSNIVVMTRDEPFGSWHSGVGMSWWPRKTFWLFRAASL